MNSLLVLIQQFNQIFKQFFDIFGPQMTTKIFKLNVLRQLRWPLPIPRGYTSSSSSESRNKDIFPEVFLLTFLSAFLTIYLYKRQREVQPEEEVRIRNCRNFSFFTFFGVRSQQNNCADKFRRGFSGLRPAPLLWSRWRHPRGRWMLRQTPD